MITVEQIKAARMMLDLKQAELAKKAGRKLKRADASGHPKCKVGEDGETNWHLARLLVFTQRHGIYSDLRTHRLQGGNIPIKGAQGNPRLTREHSPAHR